MNSSSLRIIKTYSRQVSHYIPGDTALKKRIQNDVIESLIERSQGQDLIDPKALLGDPKDLAKSFIDNMDFPEKESTTFKSYSSHTVAFEYQSDRRILGLPLIHINFNNNQWAKGLIAIGPKSFGLISIGGVSLGVFCLGGVGIGLVSIAASSIGLLASIGAVCISLFFSVGVVSVSNLVALGMVAAAPIVAMPIVPDGASIANMYLLPGDYENFIQAVGQKSGILKALASYFCKFYM